MKNITKKRLHLIAYKKRFLCSLLSISLITSVTPILSFADVNDTQTNQVNIEVLNQEYDTIGEIARETVVVNGYKYIYTDTDEFTKCSVFKDEVLISESFKNKSKPNLIQINDICSNQILELPITEILHTDTSQGNLVQDSMNQTAAYANGNNVEYAIIDQFGSSYTNNNLGTFTVQNTPVTVKESYSYADIKDLDYLLVGKTSIYALATYFSLPVSTILSALAGIATVHDTFLVVSGSVSIVVYELNRYWSRFAYVNGQYAYSASKTEKWKIFTHDRGGVSFDKHSTNQHYDFDVINSICQKAVRNSR